MASLAVLALGMLHGLLYHLRAILLPFVLSGFIVLALQPSVDVLHGLLSGRAYPYRWCVCCKRRKLVEIDGEGLADESQTNPRWAEQVPLLRRDISIPVAALQDTLTPHAVALQVQSENLFDDMIRFISVFIVLLTMICAIALTIDGMCQGALQMKEHWEAYRQGLSRAQTWIDAVFDRMAEDFHVTAELDQHIKKAYDTILRQAQDTVLNIVDTIATGLTTGLVSATVMLLYVMFWLLQPLPMGGKVGKLVRSYLYKKTLVSCLYGLCVACLFAADGVDLASFFGVLSFFCNFVPEVGAFVSMMAPVPIILLDGRLSNPFAVLAVALVGQLLIKFVACNVLEVKLVERDQTMSIHPVWVILGLCYFGFIWGPLGMLISVPMLAMVKTAALSARAWGDDSDDHSVMAEAFLACLEGRARATPEDEDSSLNWSRAASR